ncbi:hypothetical protein HMPREF1383_02391 [Enterococcus faecium V689]|nr:hypothetical protein HMPREF1383_02391 [Enterococcus faecium V689]
MVAKAFLVLSFFKAIIHSDSSLLMGKELLFLAIYPFRILQLHTANGFISASTD